MPPFWWLPEGGGRLSIPGRHFCGPSPICVDFIPGYVHLCPEVPLLLEQSWSQGSLVSNVPLSIRPIHIAKKLQTQAPGTAGAPHRIARQSLESQSTHTCAHVCTYMYTYAYMFRHAHVQIFSSLCPSGKELSSCPAFAAFVAESKRNMAGTAP